MPIREFSFLGVPRAKVGFFPELPSSEDLKRFIERKFFCVPCTAESLRDPNSIGQFDAVIFSQRAEQRNSLAPVLRDTVPELLNHGVHLYVRIAADPDGTSTARKLIVDALIQMKVPLANLNSEERARVPKELRERERSDLAPYVYIFDSSVDWSTVAHLVCDHPAENTADKTLPIDGIEGLPTGNRDELVLLLQRAFWNCGKLHLQPMAEGLSGAPVFKVYAALKAPLAGTSADSAAAAWPYLHFVKIGPRKKIVDEYDNYIGRALDYVPFHLGPRLRLERCNLGAFSGILVGDFVEGAEPIRDSAPAGRAGHAIANLFDKTIGAWRKQAFTRADITIEHYLEGKWLSDDGTEIQVPPSRAQIIQRLGGQPDIAPLRTLFDRGKHFPVLVAPAHGDLHATNVLVRGSDAIIIDFEKVTDEFPVLYDPASLEGGLLVEGFGQDARCDTRPEEILKSISRLYTLDALSRHVVPCHAADPSSWFYDCVGQIRALSRYAILSDDQYALVLAVCLIRKGSNPAQFSPRLENLRAIAFVLGAEILGAIGAKLT